MSMMTLKCPKCGAEAKLSLTDTSYSGPRRCWKCHEFFTITIYNNQVTSCEPLSKEEYERQQETKKATEKSRGGIDFSRQAQLEFPQTASEKPQGGTHSSTQEDIDIFKILAGKSRGGIDFIKRDEPAIPQKPPEKSRGGIDLSRQEEPGSFQKAAEQPRGGIDFVKRDVPVTPPKPVEKRQDFIRPVSPKEPSSQTEPKGPTLIYPPDRIQTFVPLEDIKEEPQKTQKSKSPQERQRDYTKPLSYKESSSRTDPEGRAIFPPDRIQTFVPLEDIKEEPQKPQKPTPRRKDTTPL